MASQTAPEIVLYDLACTKNVCFSPVVWRIRLLLNYKQIPYQTIFLEFPDIEPTLKALGITSQSKYTVPAIHHVRTNTYMMDSTPIAQFIESTYPSPPVPLISELGREIEAQGRALAGKTFRYSILPREMKILSTRSQEYFRRTREAEFGHPLEDLLDQEEDSWNSVAEAIGTIGGLMQTNKADGPFVLGSQLSYTDCFIAGYMQSAKVVDEGVFQRLIKDPGHRAIYEACLPYTERKD